MTLRRPDLRARRPFLSVLLGALALGCLIAPAVGCRALMSEVESHAVTHCVEEQLLYCLSGSADLTQCANAVQSACAGG